MTVDVFRFEFDRTVSLIEAEMTLHLAMIALEGLVGPARVLLDAAYHVDEARHVLIVDGTTPIGAALVRIFTGLIVREFGEDGFEVSRTRAISAVEGSAA